MFTNLGHTRELVKNGHLMIIWNLDLWVDEGMDMPGRRTKNNKERGEEGTRDGDVGGAWGYGGVRHGG